MNNLFNKTNLILVLIIICISFVYAELPVLLRYQNSNSSRTNYKLTVKTNMAGGSQAEVFIQMNNNKNQDGKINSRVSFFIVNNGERIGPFIQDLGFNIMGIFQVDLNDIVSEPGNTESNFIDIIPFFPQLPRPRTFGKDTWKDIIAATDIDGNNVQVEISNEIVKIDTDNKICTISGRGHNFERTYLVVRNTDFDYEKGEIINSNLRVGYVNKKDNTRLVSEMTMQRVERK